MAPRDIQEVCAGGVVVASRAGRDEVCLILRDRHGPRAWNLPKGHVDAGEDVTAAAVREVREETGLTAQIGAPLPSIHYRFTVPNDPAIHAKTVHFFLLRPADTDVPRPRDAEVLEARWMPFEEAINKVAHDNERRVLEAAQHLLAHRHGE